jgi:hypothetical protein
VIEGTQLIPVKGFIGRDTRQDRGNLSADDPSDMMTL